MNHLRTLFLAQELNEVKRTLFRLVRLIKMTLDFRKPDRLVIITGSSPTHQKSLIQLLVSINTFAPEAEVHVFDFGLGKTAQDEVISAVRTINFFYKKYDFSEKPPWMDISNSNKGEWAWKADCINTVVKNDLTNAQQMPTTYLWLDAGNKFINKPQSVLRYIQNYGFWSPSSDGLVEKWTFPKQIDLIVGDTRFNKKVNLNGAMIGFSSRSSKALDLLKEWFKYSMIREVIAPEGSDKSNHRQDQSLLTLLAYSGNIAPGPTARNLHLNSILQHQDIG
jgi:hypothetical protein